MKNEKHSKTPSIAVAKYELALLNALLECKYIPVSRFVMSSSHTESAIFTALAPVYLEDKYDTMEMVKVLSDRLAAMAERKLISIDYDSPLADYDYDIHRNSDLFHYFEDTVKEGSKRPGFLCDIAEIDCGRVGIAPLGLITAKKFKKPRS